MTDEAFHPVGNHSIYASESFFCQCDREVIVCTWDEEPFRCACGRRYRFVARVEETEITT